MIKKCNDLLNIDHFGVSNNFFDNPSNYSNIKRRSSLLTSIKRILKEFMPGRNKKK